MSAPEIMGELLKFVEICIANEEDVQKSLGIQLDVDVSSGKLDASIYKRLAQQVMERYPNVNQVAITLRESLVPARTIGQPVYMMERISTPHKNMPLLILLTE